MFISTFLKWFGDSRDSISGINFDALGLFGLLTLLIGAATAAVGAIIAFAPQVNLPERIIGFTPIQVAVALSFTVFLWTFAMQFAQATKIGLTLAWIAAAVAVVGGVLETNQSRSATSGGAPRSF